MHSWLSRPMSMRLWLHDFVYLLRWTGLIHMPPDWQSEALQPVLFSFFAPLFVLCGANCFSLHSLDYTENHLAMKWRMSQIFTHRPRIKATNTRIMAWTFAHSCKFVVRASYGVGVAERTINGGSSVFVRLYSRWSVNSWKGIRLLKYRSCAVSGNI